MSMPSWRGGDLGWGEQPQRGLVGNAHQGALGLFAGIAERQGMKHATIPGIRVDDVADELDQTEVEQTVPAGPELFPASGFLFPGLWCWPGTGQRVGCYPRRPSSFA